LCEVAVGLSRVPDRFELPVGGLPAAWLCLVQRVPAGDPTRVRAVARRSGSLAAELRRTADALLSGVESALWRGPAHQALVAQLRVHTPQLSATAERYDGYATALIGYAGVLEDTAGALLALRRQLQQRSDALTSPAGTGLQFPTGLGAVPPGGPGADLGAELLPLARAFKTGYDRWADGLDRCIRALHCVDEHDPTRDLHGFGAFAHQLGHAAMAVVSPFEQAILHPSLRNISACLGDLNAGLSALGLGLLFLCPPAAAACLSAATVLAVAQLAIDSTRRAHGEPVATTRLGLEFAAAIPLGGNTFRALRAAEDVVHLVPGGGLLAHEGINGAHTLAKHVGKPESFLHHRLATEPHIKGASTFYGRQTAENSISELIHQERSTVNRWLAGKRVKLQLEGRSTEPIGVLVARGSAGATPESGIRVILRRTDALGIGFYIETAMVIE
jgi:Bacterial CdiA-CT RNAse A domain